MILVPVKNLARAKQRLAQVLEQSSRTELAQAMLADVLEALVESSADDVSLVTSDPFAAQLADHHRFAVIHDDSNLSETDAIEMATRACQSRGIQTSLVIPADIPLIEAADIHAIYQSAAPSGTVLVPAADQRGTNAALRRPAALFPLRFGNDSFVPHLVAAIATHATCVVLSLPRIALDIDTPEDLQQLVNAEGEKPSQRLARKFGFSEGVAFNPAAVDK
jgi:2-phospho-L-lactate guanylyltransferase